ncbi:LexA family protein [Spiribacter onubensis]|uniref:XRE family transcriptional regulator n=1 Tax=Spiribacter onubensis TaxID=3122420 RepID=A0ABV3S7Y1_9GAMM
MAFKDDIRKLREKAGLSQRQLGARIGVSGAAIQRWENGEARPRGERVKDIALALGVTQTELLGLESEVSDAEMPGGRVPLISWVQAGEFVEAVDIYQPGVADDWIPVRRNVGPNAFALTVHGDSMVSQFGDRSYPPGTVIVVDPSVEPSPGKRVVAKLIDGGEHSVTFKELQYDAGRYFLKPLNPQYPTVMVDENTVIVGVVVSSYRDD